jgi:glutathione synthase/RimK-type ligase-like ATP-grasp enzyme
VALPEILIIGTSVDNHIDRVLRFIPVALYCRFNIDEYPVKNTISVTYTKGHRQILMRTGSGIADITGVKTVWFRRLGKPGVSDLISGTTHKNFAYAETEAMIYGLTLLLPGAFWVSGFNATKNACQKPYQLAVAAGEQLVVPATLFTNDVEAFHAFYRQCRGRVVYKTLHSPSVQYEDARCLIFTSIVDEAALEKINQVQYCPCIFQELVEKQYELRITVVGGIYFTVKIFSQEQEASKTDWRAGNQDALRYEVTTLPQHIQYKLQQLMIRMQLQYGAVDMIVTPQDEYVFLEVNPHGAWGWIERLTALPVSEAMAQLLLSGSALESYFPHK